MVDNELACPKVFDAFPLVWFLVFLLQFFFCLPSFLCFSLLRSSLFVPMFMFVCLSVWVFFFYLFFLSWVLCFSLISDQPLDVWTKTQLKIRKTKIGKKDFEEKTRQETKIEKILMKENFVIEYFDVVLIMKQKQRRKKRQKNKNKSKKLKKTKKKDKKEERKIKREKPRKRKWKKGGGQKRLRDKKGRQAKTNIKCPFLGEKQGFWSIGSKERKGNKTTKEKWGGFRSKWAGPCFFFCFFVFPIFFCFMFFFFWGGGLTFLSFLLFKKTCNRLSVSQTPSWSKVRSLLFCF